MPAEDHFINRGLLKVKVNDFLSRELRRAGYAGVDLQKTPLGMRVVVYASRPGMVIGRRGTTVRELTETLEHDFGLEAPQIEVSEVEVPELHGSIMAERLAQRLERGDHFRRAAYGVLRRIVGAGAKGVEISIAGKLTSRRARYQKFRSGFVAKTGEPIRTAVSHGIAYAIMKPGILGIQVRIMLPDAVAPDRPIIIHREVEIEPVPVPEAAEGAEAAEIEVTEEELPIEEAPPIEEFIEESEEPSPVAATPSESELEPVPEHEPEDVPPLEEKAEPEKPKPKPKKKPKAEPVKKKAPAKAKPKPKPKPKAKKAAEKPKAKPKAKKKVEEKPKAKPKTPKKAAEKPKAKPKKTKVEAKPKAKKKKAEEKPKSKTKAAEKPKAESKAKAKKDTTESKSKKSETKASKEKAAKSTKSASKK